MTANWSAAFLTSQVALGTTFILALLGIPVAWWLAFTRCKFKMAVEAIVTLPLVLPPTVLGFYLLNWLAPETPIGGAFEQIFGQRLVFSFSAIVLGSVIYNLPFAVRPAAAAFASVDRALIEAARCLGGGQWQLLSRIVLPLAWPGVLSGLVLTFAHAMGEFGVVLMLGGNIPGVTRTLSVAIYDDVQAMELASAQVASLGLVGCSFLALLLVQILQRGPQQRT